MVGAKFRETMWFKKGELAAARAESGSVEVAPEEDLAEAAGDSLPIDDRYQDDGTLAPHDSMTFGLHTGRTTSMARIPAAAATSDVTEEFLLSELTWARRGSLALFGLAAALAAAFVLHLAY